MIVPHVIASSLLDHLKELLDSILSHKSPAGLVILGSIDNPIDESSADELFQSLPIPVGGGLFPALLLDGEVSQSGWLVYAVYDEFSVTVVEGISHDYEVTCALSSVETSLIIVDGHAKRISKFLERVYIGSQVATRFFGGGAGSLKSDSRRCIISNSGLLRDAAVVIETSCRSGIGVSHGWRPASRILRATATDGNVVRQLDFKPAFDVYKNLIAEEFNATLDPNDLIVTANMFPLGIRRIGGALIVRDPIAVTDDGGLVCVGEIESDSFLYLLTSDLDTLLKASLDATMQAEADMQAPVTHKIIFDCISRFLLMKESFSSEIAMLRHGDTPVSGVLSIGEIASSSDGFLEFYNKTTAVAAFSGG